MRILMVNKYLYPKAGAETYMLELSRSLIKAGHEVAFFGMNHPELTKLGPTCTVEEVYFGGDQTLLKRIKQVSRAVHQNITIRRKFKNFCKQFKADLIHAHNVYNQIPASLFKGCKLPILMTAHDYKPVCPSYNLYSKGSNCTKCLKGSFLSCIKNKCVQNSLFSSSLAAVSSYAHKKLGTYTKSINHYVAPSSFMKSMLVKGGIPSDKVSIIHNFTTVGYTLNEPGQNLLYAGRICKEKGVDTLINAYEKLPQPRPKLIICGTGPLKIELQKVSEEKALNIEWKGYVSPERVKEEMKYAAAVVVPSKWNENCSMTIMESLNHGRPVIASDAGGNPELIKNGYNGYVFKAGDVDSLVSSLHEFSKSDKLNLSSQAAYSGQKFFTPQTHLKELTKVYQGLLHIDHKEILVEQNMNLETACQGIGE